MAQNIYDDPEFFAAYGQLPRSLHGLNAAPEWPTLRALLPPLKGRKVVDLGCGYGWFCRWAAEEGAAKVVGYDLSTKMLERARSETGSSHVRYVEADLDHLKLDDTFDLAYSSLALHYLENLGGFLEAVADALEPDGRFVFSMEHPIFTAPREQRWIKLDDGRRAWPVDSYRIEGRRESNWLAEGVVKQHRTMGTILNALIGTGFVLDHVEDFCPSEEQIAADPSLASERDRPTFLVAAAHKGG